uniref:Uncharacterized protein n=1 Tax=Ignisphaera aggregans TaxID=334771 RepID=A0A7C4BDF5_9CREN
MKCLSTHVSDNDILIAQRSVEMFVNEAKNLSTVDGCLIKLATLVLRLEDVWRDKSRSRKAFEKILMCDEVRDSLRPLTRYTDIVEYLISTNPRYKPLATYADPLLAVLRELEPSEEVLEVTRPATFYIEHAEAEHQKPQTQASAHVQIPVKVWKRRRGRRKQLAIGVAVALLIALLVVLYILSSGGSMRLYR